MRFDSGGRKREWKEESRRGGQDEGGTGNREGGSS